MLYCFLHWCVWSHHFVVFVVNYVAVPDVSWSNGGSNGNLFWPALTDLRRISVVQIEQLFVRLVLASFSSCLSNLLPICWWHDVALQEWRHIWVSSDRLNSACCLAPFVVLYGNGGPLNGSKLPDLNDLL